MSSESLAIAQVSPHPWGSRHEINEFVRRTSEELAARGHRVLIVAPSESRTAIRESRRLIREARPRSPGRCSAARTRGWSRSGRAFPLPSGPRAGPRRSRSTSAGRWSACSGAVPLDLVHVHEPFAPSTGSAALRHSQSLNVATFHEPVERVLSTQVARMLVEVFFGRIDERTGQQRGHRRAPPALLPGPVPAGQAGRRRRRAGPRAVGRRAGCGSSTAPRRSEVPSGCCCGRLRKLPEDLDWEGVIWFDGPTDPLARVSRRLRERLRRRHARGTASRRSSWPGRTSPVSPPAGCARPRAVVRKAFAAGAVPVVSDLELYRELVGRGRARAALPARRRADADRPAREALPRLGSARAAPASPRGTPRRGAALGRGDRRGRGRLPAARRAGATTRRATPRSATGSRERDYIHCDLHMHTDHSPDCATPAGAAARDRQGAGAGRDRDHRPQRDLGGAARPRRSPSGSAGSR